MDYVTLSNGDPMPMVGFGVFQITDAKQCEKAVLDALDAGYRHIDTAQAYGNEEAVGNAIAASGIDKVVPDRRRACGAEVGNAIAASGIDKEEVFVTTKVWVSNAGYENALRSIEESRKKLKKPYIDMVLIHQPFGDYYGTYRAMEELYRMGRVKAIGVSNFSPDRLVDLAINADIPPMVDQVETHVFNQQTEARKWMDKYGCRIESWGPFAEGKNNLFSNPVLTDIGGKYGKTAAQVALRFLLQKGIAVIPKSVHAERMRENIDVFDFRLSEGDMGEIEKLDTGTSLFVDHSAPETSEMFNRWEI